MKSLKKIRFAALFAALAIAVVGCSHSAGGGVGDASGGVGDASGGNGGTGGGQTGGASPAKLLADKVINGVTLTKTGELDVITTQTTVHMTDDSAWSGYVASGASDYYKGVFIKDRAVTLSPFAMGKYEVTQELYKEVMGTNPSYCVESSNDYKNMLDGETQRLRPVENVNWYHAIAFCNKLSIMQGLEPCYEVSGITDWANLAYSSIPTSSDATWNAATCDFTKKGYRLPTEAEWEFAARGGDPTKPEWRYAFSGVNVAEGNMVHNGSTYLDNDANLEDYAWYDNNAYDKGSGNAGYGTHEVGTKKANTLGLYDMSGNVWEWCWDWYSSTVSTAAATNPTGPASGSFRLFRGGSWYYSANICAVSIRSYYIPVQPQLLHRFPAGPLPVGLYYG